MRFPVHLDRYLQYQIYISGACSHRLSGELDLNEFKGIVKFGQTLLDNTFNDSNPTAGT